MTDRNKRHVEIVLDRSGSMDEIREDAEGGLREFIRKLGDITTPTTVTLNQFDTRYETVFTNVALDQVPEWHLVPRGSTALRDAIGYTINALGERLAALDEDDRPGQVIMVIQTDGKENASTEFSDDQIKSMITVQQDKWRWDFVFLGADQNAFEAGARYGISKGSTISYSKHNTVGTYAATADSLNRSSVSGARPEFTEKEREEAEKK